MQETTADKGKMSGGPPVDKEGDSGIELRFGVRYLRSFWVFEEFHWLC